ncbi:MAG: Type 1 glutamine amidotransferase-like domain-containing protein [bacterium]|nr:Type 1 glutamine amidotransferase-like domain-containing protein [bacterium]
MKTILLTSSGKFVTDGDMSFLDKPISRMKIAYITTAAKGARDNSYVTACKQRMTELNFDFEEIDIEGKNEDKLMKMLSDKEVIFVEGGNTSYLLKAVRESSFDKVVKNLIDRGVIYIGSSAGSYIACPTIEVSTWKKPGEEKERFGVTDLTAMNIVPFLVKAHYTPEQKEFLKEKIKNAKYPVKILTDEQALLVRNGKVKLLGRGEEIRI